MRLLVSLFVLAMNNAQTAVSVSSPFPRFSLGVCGGTFGSINDTTLNGHTVSLTVGASGISVIPDVERGYCISRSSSAVGGVLISSSSPGASYTKSIWAKLSGFKKFPNLWSAYTQGGDPAGSHLLFLHDKGDISAGHNQIGENDQSKRTIVRDYQVLGANVWTHIVATFDATTQTISIYQNGIKTATNIGSPPGAAWNGSNSLPSLLLDWGGENGWIGCIADINLYDSALSPADVSNIYTTQLATTVCGTNVVAHTTPIVPIPVSAGFPQPQLSLGVCGTTAPDSMSVLTDVVDVSGSRDRPTSSVTLRYDSVSSASIVASSSPVRGRVISLEKTVLPITSSRLGSSYTVSAWIYLTNLVDFPTFVSSQDQAQVNSIGAFSLFCHTGSQNSLAVFHVPDASGPGVGARRNLNDANSAGPLPTNTWIHVAVTFDETTNMFALYRNGVQTASGATGNSARWNASNSINIQLGAYYGVRMQGQISDVTIWDSALTATQMSNVYTRQSAYSVCDPATAGESDAAWCNAMASSYSYAPSDWACYSSSMCINNPSYTPSRSQRFPNTDLPGGPSSLVLSVTPCSSSSVCQEICASSNLAYPGTNCESWVWDSNDNLCYTKTPRKITNAQGLIAGRMCPQNAIAPDTVATSLKQKWLNKCITNA